MGYISNSLLIAEKPSVALNISRALGATQRNEGYFEGNGYVVTFALGHLLSLCDLEDYDPKLAGSWTENALPFIPKEFKYKVRTDKFKKTDSGANKQFKIIKRLAERKDVSMIINCCDSDREGELIGTVIIRATGVKKPVYRLWVNEQTPEDIKRGMSNLKTEKDMFHLQEAAYSRQWTDWPIGINFTRIATLRFGNGRTLNIGRVIMPTVKLIYDRDMEIRNFKPQAYYELRATFLCANGTYNGVYINAKGESKFFDTKEINKIHTLIYNRKGVVKEKKVHLSESYAPRLFNLTDLQGRITSKYNGWTSDKVDKIAQKLYENQLITYPRTKSRFLEETLISKAEKVLNAHKKGLPYEDKLRFHRDNRVFNSKKVDGHSAIIPTYIIPSGLSADEEKVYNEIKWRFLAQFMPPAKYENTEIITEVTTENGSFNFITKGKVVKVLGWLEVYGRELPESENGEDDDKEVSQKLPEIRKGEPVKVQKADVLDKQTEPPKPYTESTLFKTMETCGKKVSKDEFDEILKGYEIGTVATRAETLKKIIFAGYVERQGKALRITDTGIRLVEIFPIKELMDLDFTGKIEKALYNMEKGMYARDKFLQRIFDFTCKGVEKMKSMQGAVGNGNNKGFANGGSVLGKCPVCGKNVIETSKAFGCSGYKEGCKWAVWKNDRFLAAFKKVPTRSMVKDLLKKGSVHVKGLTGRTGSKFDATMGYIKKDNGYWGWDFVSQDNDSSGSCGSRKVLGACPVCGSDVVENNRSYGCTKEGCDFIIRKEDEFLYKFKKRMTEAIAKELVCNGQVFLEGMYSEKKKSYFNATLLYKKKGRYWGYSFQFGN